MANSAKQGSNEEILASTLTNKALAHRIEMIANFPRSYDAAQRKAFFAEAARRLRWPDNYAKHNIN